MNYVRDGHVALIRLSIVIEDNMLSIRSMGLATASLQYSVCCSHNI